MFLCIHNEIRRSIMNAPKNHKQSKYICHSIGDIFMSWMQKQLTWIWSSGSKVFRASRHLQGN